MNSKSKALSKKKDYEKPVAHKAVGGTLYFSHPKSQESVNHEKHLKLLESRKKDFRKFLFPKA